MQLTQYGDYFFLYILILALIPAVILALCGKKIKYYGLLISIIMIVFVINISFKNLLFFIVYEISLIKLFSIFRKKKENKVIYYIILILSIMPVVILKISSILEVGTIGFLGLSYLNFKAIQMVIEIQDGIIKEVDIVNVIYFFMFFPTLSSGPVDRSRRFDEETNQSIKPSTYVDQYLYEGVYKIIIGVGYKFVIAYLINILWMSKIPSEVNLVNSLNYMYAYSLYLFFDFAGYSTFAIGTSYILGVKSPENFNSPFLSKDMKEFWTRWHISLSRWFGDYVYSRILLDSMRKKHFKSRHTASHFAQMITMITMGIWHGLHWFYIIYGIYQGVALVLTDIYQRKSKIHKKYRKKICYQVLQIIITFNVACFGLLLFSGYLFN